MIVIMSHLQNCIKLGQNVYLKEISEKSKTGSSFLLLDSVGGPQCMSVCLAMYACHYQPTTLYCPETVFSISTKTLTPIGLNNNK